MGPRHIPTQMILPSQLLQCCYFQPLNTIGKLSVKPGDCRDLHLLLLMTAHRFCHSCRAFQANSSKHVGACLNNSNACFESTASLAKLAVQGRTGHRLLDSNKCSTMHTVQKAIAQHVQKPHACLSRFELTQQLALL